MTQVGAGAPHYRMAYIWTISLVAAMGGLLFGYDWVVIGGAKPFFEKYFDLSTEFLRGWANSCALVGCLIGALVSGALSDKFGRKRLLILAGVLFVATGIGVALARDNALATGFTWFVIFRILGGVGIGLASNLSPMYIAEVSPAEVRGKFVSINQLTIVLGVVGAQLINWLIAERIAEGATAQEILQSWNGQYGWRWMFGAGTVPGVLFFLLMFAVPESPRWLVKNGKDDKARDILERIGGADYARREVDDIKQTLVNEIQRVNFGDLLEPKLMKILALGVFLAVFQQWCGINVMFNYAEEVFKAAGYGMDDLLLNIVITGSVLLVFTFVAIFTVDHIGRKALLLLGAGGLALIYGVMGTTLLPDSVKESLGFALKIDLRLLVGAAIGCYACTLAPVVWVVLSEIFPNRIRGAAMSVSVFALWTGCLALTFTFPYLQRGLGEAGTFWIYGAICAVGLVVVAKFLPETKGKSLEQIERELVD